MAMMMTYHPLLHHLLIHLNHLIHACLNVLLIPFHLPKGYARLLLSAACLLEPLLYCQHLFTTPGMNTMYPIDLVMFIVTIIIQLISLRT